MALCSSMSSSENKSSEEGERDSLGRLGLLAAGFRSKRPELQTDTKNRLTDLNRHDSWLSSMAFAGCGNRHHSEHCCSEIAFTDRRRTAAFSPGNQGPDAAELNTGMDNVERPTPEVRMTQPLAFSLSSGSTLFSLYFWARLQIRSLAVDFDFRSHGPKDDKSKKTMSSCSPCAIVFPH
ncbi:hypothetical protein EYF80_003108 [Liparis tanakae]|uniref:Uncharacterized protein n=1 Tax=Liparis tanakae TaxID=230148 RepID=A0A4Z2J958_9TELE|nr:hypothetical protein EYF80_003108 [Liparis tanakae]